MAPAVTSDTSPCVRASHLHAEAVSTFPQTANFADLCDPGSILEVESVMSTTESEATNSINSAVTGIPNGVLSTGSQIVVSPVTVDAFSKTTMDLAGNGSVMPEPVNGIPAPSVANMVTTSARIVNVKEGQGRTFNVVIKNNNGKCGTGVVQANQHRVPSKADGLLHAICNGGNVSTSTSDSQSIMVSSNHPVPASSVILTRPASLNRPLVHRMVITPKTISVIPSDVSDKSIKNDIKILECCDLPASDADNKIGEGSSTCMSPTPSVAKLEDICLRQKVLKSRVERLLCRLRRLQTREANSFVKKQLLELISHIRRSKEPPTVDGAGESQMLSLNAMSNYRSLSTSQLVGLVQRMQSADLVTPSCTEETPQYAWRADKVMRSELSCTGSKLKTNLRHIEQAVDSDATQSSSGGESDGEMNCESVTWPHDFSASVNNSSDRVRAQLVWSSERAMIASRWTWLQAQVSDIEYKIRQQSDIYRQLRQLKGAAVSYRSCQGEVPAPTMSAADQKSRLDNGVVDARSDCGSNSETASLSDAERSSVNNDVTCRAARCSAVRSGRQRRLLRSVNTILQAVNQRKAVAPSTVQCTACYPPATPCALCAGRVNHVLRVGSHQSIHERISLLDPAFHPVLSFSQDVLLTSRLAECIRSGTTRSSDSVNAELGDRLSTASLGKSLTLRISKAHLKSLHVQTVESGHLTESDSKRGASVRDPQSVSYHGSRLISSKEGSCSQASAATKIYQGRHATQRAYDTFRRKKRLSLASKRLGMSANMTSLKPVGRPPRLSQSASSASLKDAMRRHSSAGTNRTVFDINNVILPYNASTSAARLEILQYKEIDTPKWRELRVDELVEDAQQEITPKSVSFKRRKRDSCNSRVSVSAGDVAFIDELRKQEHTDVTTASDLDAVGVDTEQETDSEVEDMSDEAFSSRHLRYEIYEKKQFFPATGQHRRSHSNRSESDQSTLPHARSPEPTPTLDFCCESLPVLSQHSSETMLYQQESVSPCAVIFDGHIRRNSSSSSVVARTSFSFDPLTVSRFAEPTNASDVVAAATRSWPPRSFPLDDSDIEQLHDDRSNSRRHSTSANRHSLTVAGACSLPSLSSAHTQSAVCCPNDPGWTVAVQDEGCNGQMPKFVIKIAKV